ncbi:MAG: glutaminase [Gordonia sp. (in: high G+C Gram-positive bacteria)]|uniref:glutaminase n=1 Tax=Gordonia sp. (in: high G+C Gram-positive bacteria) TaxID=84139 RepID=UPI0039E51A18
MRSPIPDYLASTLSDVRDDDSGAVADYIPELAKADPDRLAVAVAMTDGYLYEAGDTDVEFSIQSISKPFVYALALADRGFDDVLDRVGVEPTGDAFNEISLEPVTGRPRNPMINAGALTVHTLVGAPGAGPGTRTARLLDGLSAFAGRRLHVDEAVFESELAHSFRNRALANMLRANDVVAEDPLITVAGYTRQCAVLVNTRDLAMMAATLANKGVNPLTGEEVVSARVVRQTLSVMSTCGMYDGAGDWMTRVGVPAKSGVSGGLIAALPGQLGIATFSPRLDAHGNSVRGTELFQRFAEEMNLHIMEANSAPLSVIRSTGVIDHGGRPLYVMTLQGSIRFAGGERVTREIVLRTPPCRRVAVDVSRVYTLGEAAHLMLRQTLERLCADGHRVYLVDADARFGPDFAGDLDVGLVTSLDEIRPV